ncbi:hypothetical protein JXL21_04225 [Candidatus Bathyarchaeota archaeon]|nr:hypothetical protein [Candidatus Bathyarchaeota archaeon]
MSVLYDLEEDFTIRECEVSSLKIMIENWLEANDFSLRQSTPPHMIMATRRGGARRLTPRVRLFQASFLEENSGVILRFKIQGNYVRDKYHYWVILVQLFRYLNSKLGNSSISEVVSYLLNDEYKQYLKDRGKILMK